MSDSPINDAAYADVWVVLPTYDELENLPKIAPAILEQLPGATLLVVDDSSPDGTGQLADRMAAQNPRVRVLHRPGKEGLGKAYIDGFKHALDAQAGRVVQMDADWSHDPKYLPELVGRLGDMGSKADGSTSADLVIGSRYVSGGGVVNWGITRKIISRGGSTFARVVLRLSPHDLTGGFKAWRHDALAALPWDDLHSGGYVFQIETTFRATRKGAKVAEIPIVFVDRVVGTSKMSRKIIVEALAVVLQLRWEELRSRRRRRS
jgi:dolichol-phosphate mannosyltransferase